MAYSRSGNIICTALILCVWISCRTPARHIVIYQNSAICRGCYHTIDTICGLLHQKKVHMEVYLPGSDRFYRKKFRKNFKTIFDRKIKYHFNRMSEADIAIFQTRSTTFIRYYDSGRAELYTVTQLDSLYNKVKLQ